MSKKLFDYVIGNPPYNDEFGGLGNGENETYAPPVYNTFMDAAYEVAQSTELIHPGRFLFKAGSTPKAWNEKMLSDPHFKVLGYKSESKEVFPGTKIRGGVCVSYRDDRKNFGAIEVFTPYPEVNSIIQRTKQYSSGKNNIASIMYIQNRFNLEALYKDYPNYRAVIGSGGKDKRFETGIFEKISLFREHPVNVDDVAVYGVIQKKRLFRFFPLKYTETDHENLEKYKVVVMKSSGEGVFGETMAPFDILKPGQAFTRSFISIGAFDTETEAENCRKYMKSKFSRTLLYAKKVTQDNPIDTWSLIPLQDFTSQSDIDWLKSISDIDRQLYRKYGLSDDEINFIETNVKEMS